MSTGLIWRCLHLGGDNAKYSLSPSPNSCTWKSISSHNFFVRSLMSFSALKWSLMPFGQAIAVRAFRSRACCTSISSKLVSTSGRFCSITASYTLGLSAPYTMLFRGVDQAGTPERVPKSYTEEQTETASKTIPLARISVSIYVCLQL